MNNNIYQDTNDHELNIRQYYYTLFSLLPSVYSPKIKYTSDLLGLIENRNFVLLLEEMEETNYRLSSNKIYINHETKTIILLDKFIINNVELYNYKIYYHNSTTKDILDYIKVFSYFEYKNKKTNINIITNNHGHLDVEEFDLDVKPIDIKLNYGENFVKVHDVILKKLSENNSKGIVLLHGTPGSGKTTYIKYLTKLIPNKQIIFIPPTFAESLTDPGIISFLMNYKNSILIIEDAEKVISEREFNGSSTAVSNILNITDGILGDCLNIQIIATFNMKKEKIDKALLRKGRLICEYEFNELTIEDSNNLLKYLNKDYQTDVKMTLSDIYYIDEELIKVDKKVKKIGL